MCTLESSMYLYTTLEGHSPATLEAYCSLTADHVHRSQGHCQPLHFKIVCMYSTCTVYVHVQSMHAHIHVHVCIHINAYAVVYACKLNIIIITMINDMHCICTMHVSHEWMLTTVHLDYLWNDGEWVSTTLGCLNHLHHTTILCTQDIQ